MDRNQAAHRSCDWSREFPGNQNCPHLNHAGLAPWPRRTFDLLRDFAEDHHRGGLQRWPEWENRVSRARQAIATLLAVEPTTVAFVKNTSEAISQIAYGLSWSRGDNVVVGRREFPANRLPWESLRRSFGVEIRWLDYRQSQSIEEDLAALIDRHTRLLAVSSIHYENGYRMNLPALGDACRQSGTLFCVDAIQSLGAVPFNARQCHADFVCAGSHKWLLSPEGVGILHCRSDLMPKLKLNQYGWHMTATPDNYNETNWRPAADARRFECGTMNTMGLCALAASASLILELGIENVARLIADKVDYLIDNIKREHYEIITPLASRQRGGILSFRHRHKSNRELYKRLREQGVLCAPRAGGVRFSPHFYTSQQDLNQALSCLEDWA